ncbi:organomercurial lyase [Nocardia salmonicida]|uniref:organomercurial lyase n=1 Tax=Nocardia salmonicida TaxID=53431 RepID=UPI0033D15A19
MRTGELAVQAGVNAQTLRYYEGRGLLALPPRSPAGYRDYPDEAVSVVRFVKRAQELGFSLAEIRELLHLAEGPDDCDTARVVAQARIDQLAQRISELERMQQSLGELTRTCEMPRAQRSCPDPFHSASRGHPVKLEILQVTDCPNVAVLEQRLRQAIVGTGIVIDLAHRVISDAGQAADLGMTGSPTLLVEGRDPFAVPGQSPSISCRLYRTNDGGIDGAPSVAAIREALSITTSPVSESEDRPAACCPAPVPESVADSLTAWRGRAQPDDAFEKAFHHAILRGFAATGGAPTVDELATIFSADVFVPQVLRRLHEADVIRLDSSGAIAAAYPFSAVPTAHRVHIDGGATVYAMCAIDALGMSAMLGADTTIETTAPDTGQPISVAVRDQQLTATPTTAVVFVGGQAAQGPSAATCCSYLNFFPDRESGQSWAATHPDISGTAVDLTEAHDLGNAIFGQLPRP